MSKGKLTRAEEIFFRDFFEHATSSGLRWMLMRNYLGFPATMGNDLDVFFPRNQFRDAVGLFRKVLAHAGGEVIHRHQRDYVFALWFRLPGGNPRHIDFYHGVTTWHGLYYLEENELWDQRCDYQGWPVPRPAHEALTLLATSLLWGGFYKDRYAGRISELLEQAEERRVLNELMDRSFGKAAELGFDPGNAVADHERDIECGRRLRAGLKRVSATGSRIKTWAKLVRYWVGELRTVVLPPGICVVVNDDKGSDELRVKAVECGEILFGGATEFPSTGFSAFLNYHRRIWLAMARNQLVISKKHVLMPWWRKPLDLTSSGASGKPHDRIEAMLKSRLP